MAVCPGFKVTGVVIPVAPNREPTTEMEEIVTGTVPDDVRVTDCVPMLPTETLPNDTDGALTVRAGMPVTGESVMLNVLVIPPASAVMVAVCAVVTLVTVALKLVLVPPDLTVTLPGNVTAGLLLVRDTSTLLLVFDVRNTEQASVAAAL